MPDLNLTLASAQWATGTLDNFRVDGGGGLALDMAQNATASDEGYEILSSGQVRYIPRYSTDMPESDRALPEIAPGQTVRVAARVVETFDLSALPGRTVIQSRAHLLSSLRPIADLGLGKVKLRVTTDSEQLLLTTNPDDVEFREEELAVSPAEPGTAPSLNTPSDGPDDPMAEDGARLSDSGGAARSVAYDRRTGARLMRADWLAGEGGADCWVVEDWTFGPPTFNQLFRIENRSTFAFGLGALRVRNSAASREYRLLFGPYLSAAALPTERGVWTGPVTALPPHSAYVVPNGTEGLVLTGFVNGQSSWFILPHSNVTITPSVRMFDASGTLVRSGSGVVSTDGATHYQVQLVVETNMQVSLRKLHLRFNVAAFDFGVAPDTRSGVPARGEWSEPSLPMRARPSQARMPKHPLMASGTATKCYQHKIPLGPASWESATHLRVPAGATAVYFDPADTGKPVTPMTIGQITQAEYASGQGEWGTVETPFESFQLYVPTLGVELYLVDGRRYDLTSEVSDLGQGKLSLVGDERPVVDALLAEAGAGLQFLIDGHVIQYAKIVSCTKQLSPNGRVMDIVWADALDYHNFDMEILNEGSGDSTPPPPASEMAYLNDVAIKSGLRGVIKDNRVFTRATTYWTAPPDMYGYGGVDSDFTNAYNGQGGTVTQEIELVANANLATAVAAPSGNQQVMLVPLVPRPTDRLEDVVTNLLSGESPDGYVYNVVDGEYLPDTRLSISGAGYDQTKGYSLINLEGNSNVFTSTPSLNPATIFNQSKDGITSEIFWRYYGGSTLPGVNDAWNPYLDWRMFATQRNRAAMQAWYPVTMNGIPQDQLDALFPNWQTVGAVSPLLQPQPLRRPSPYGVWSVSLNELRGFNGPQTPDVQYVPENGSYNRVISSSSLSFLATAGTCYIDNVEFLVESPQRLKARTPESTLDISNYGPCITGVRVHVNNVNSQENMLEFLAHVSMWGLDAEGIKLKPYSNTPDPAYAPEWYKGFVEEATEASKKRMQKKNTVQNPFVVEILPGNFPDGSEPLEFPYPVPETDPQVMGPNYQAGKHVSTALNLWEWLRSRASTFEYVGAPSWRPGQFIAVARRPEGGPGAPVRQYDVFLILEPSQINVVVGQEVSTTTSAGFVGTVKAGVGSNPSPLTINPFKEAL